jgi:DNA modification methylase
VSKVELNKIYNQDCLEGMRQLEQDSIDAIISDPPYQLSATGRGRPDQTKEGSYGKEVPFSRQQSRIYFMSKAQTTTR